MHVLFPKELKFAKCEDCQKCLDLLMPWRGRWQTPRTLRRWTRRILAPKRWFSTLKWSWSNHFLKPANAFLLICNQSAEFYKLVQGLDICMLNCAKPGCCSWRHMIHWTLHQNICFCLTCLKFENVPETIRAQSPRWGNMRRRRGKMRRRGSAGSSSAASRAAWSCSPRKCPSSSQSRNGGENSEASQLKSHCRNRLNSDCFCCRALETEL